MHLVKKTKCQMHAQIDQLKVITDSQISRIYSKPVLFNRVATSYM